MALFAALVGAYLKRHLVFIGKDEQLFIEDLTEVRAINGPKTVFLPILHKTSYKSKAISLGPLEYQLVKNTLNGDKRVEVALARAEHFLAHALNPAARFLDPRPKTLHLLTTILTTLYSSDRVHETHTHHRTYRGALSTFHTHTHTHT